MAAYRRGDSLSPYASMNQGSEPPHITEADYSYITSQDLVRDPEAEPDPDPNADDVLLFKNKGFTYTSPFPPYSIGDGKLTVGDVQDRVGLLLGISHGQAKRMKLLYKGKLLKDHAAPVRDYGVKNKSELLVMVPEQDVDDDSARSCDEEEIVVEEDLTSSSGVGVSGSDTSKRRSRKRRPKKNKAHGYDSSGPTSPRSSGVNLGVPESSAGGSRSPSPMRAANLAKIEEISSNFNTTLLPPCLRFSASPPSDTKRREDEYRKLSETILQQVILKLDAIEPNGDENVRARRKELVKKAQEVLSGLDVAKHGMQR